MERSELLNRALLKAIERSLSETIITLINDLKSSNGIVDLEKQAYLNATGSVQAMSQAAELIKSFIDGLEPRRH